MAKSVILVPADFRVESVQKYAELNKTYEDSGLAVSEFYGSLNPSPFGVTKNPKNLKKVDPEGLEAYHAELKRYGFEFNYILKPQGDPPAAGHPTRGDRDLRRGRDHRI
ncbi:MAG: hypothetical protein IJM25_04745 [Eubacterium sp.]|nr:hypothetical protein [Eubacterium sp.]